MRNVTIANNTVLESMPLPGWGGGHLPGSLTVANNVTFGGAVIYLPAAATYSSNLQYPGSETDVFSAPATWDF